MSQVSLKLEDLLRIFPETGHRLSMSLRVVDAAAFFAPRHGLELLEMRQRLLREAPEHYLAESPATDLAWLAQLTGCTGNPPSLAVIGAGLEPDLVFLRQHPPQEWLAVAGCVCFPTMWSLPEKIGLPLAAIHGPVPGLQAQIGARIDSFLARLVPGAAYGRENWGLTASAQPDQHPRHHLPAIPARATLENVWLRIEEQALIGLGQGSVLFAIRLEHFRLDRVAENRLLAVRLAASLETLSDEMAAYKRLTACRPALIDQLRAPRSD